MENQIISPSIDELVSALMPKLGPAMGLAVAEQTKAAIKELGLDKVDLKHNMFPGINDNQADSKEERVKQFMRAVLFGAKPTNAAIIKALSEGTTTAGGYLVPDEVKAEIVKWADPIAELYPRVRKMPVNSDAGNMPKASTGVTMSWDNTGHENVNFTETDPVFGQITWTVYRMNGLTKMSRELVNDSNPSIVSVVTQLFGEAVAEERDKMIAIGTDSNQPKGIYSETGIDTVAFGGAVSYAKLRELQYKLSRRYQKNGVFIMNSTILGDVMGLADTVGQPVLKDGLERGEAPLLLGKPALVQEDLPTHTILYGDLSKYIWYDREQMGIEQSKDAGDAFINHQLWLKVWERCDGSLALNGTGKSGAFVKATGITT